MADTADGHGENADVLLGEAVRLRAQRRHKEGIDKCLSAIKVAPDNAEAFEILGDLYSESRLPQAAVEAYRRSLELAPGQRRAEEKLARAALEADQATRQRQVADDLLAGRLPTRPKRPNPTATGLLSLLVPGLGQLVNQHFIKAGALLVAWLVLLGATFSAAGATAAQQRATSGLDLGAFVVAFFVPPALWWTLLQAGVYAYAVIDAALAAAGARRGEEDGW